MAATEPRFAKPPRQPFVPDPDAHAWSSGRQGLGKLRRTRAGTSERPAREVGRLGPQSIVEIVWLFRYNTTFDSMVTVRRRTDANGNSPYSPFERNRASYRRLLVTVGVRRQRLELAI